METTSRETPVVSKSATTWAIIIGAIVVFFLPFFLGYNGMVSLDENIKSLDSQVANMYSRRTDLIPMLSNVVRAAADYEGGTLTKITEYRSLASGLGQLQAMQGSGKTNTPEFNTTMATTLVAMRQLQEAYPQLQAVQGFRDMMAPIEGSENRLRVAIKDYNDSVATFNSKLRSLPYGPMYKMFGFHEKERTYADIQKGVTANEKTPVPFAQ